MSTLRLRSNEQIRLSPVRLIDQDKNMIGVVPTAEALRMAREAGMDLVEMSPNERPPVCKIMDFGKHKYELSKRQKQKHQEHKLKEVRLRPKTDAHDREIKLKRARSFLEHGDKVQFTMLFRGREKYRQDLGLEIFRGIAEELEDIGKVLAPAKAMGRRMTMVLVPHKSASGSKQKAAKPKTKAPPSPQDRATDSEPSATPGPPAESDDPNAPAPSSAE